MKSDKPERFENEKYFIKWFIKQRWKDLTDTKVHSGKFFEDILDFMNNGMIYLKKMANYNNFLMIGFILIILAMFLLKNFSLLFGLALFVLAVWVMKEWSVGRWKGDKKIEEVQLIKEIIEEQEKGKK